MPRLSNVFEGRDYHDVVSWTSAEPRELPEELIPITTIIETIFDGAARLAHRGISFPDDVAQAVATLAVHHQFNVWHSRKLGLNDEEVFGLEQVKETYSNLVASFINAHGMMIPSDDATLCMRYWEESMDETSGICENIDEILADPEVAGDKDAKLFWDRCGKEALAMNQLIDLHLTAFQECLESEGHSANEPDGLCLMCARGLATLNTDDGRTVEKSAKELKIGIKAIVAMLYLCYIVSIDMGPPGPAFEAARQAISVVEHFFTQMSHIIALNQDLLPVENTLVAVCPDATEDTVDLMVEYGWEVSRRYANQMLVRKTSNKYHISSLGAHRTMTGLNSYDAYSRGKKWLNGFLEVHPEAGKQLKDVIYGVHEIEKRGAHTSKGERLLKEYEEQRQEEGSEPETHREEAGPSHQPSLLERLLSFFGF